MPSECEVFAQRLDINSCKFLTTTEECRNEAELLLSSLKELDSKFDCKIKIMDKEKKSGRKSIAISLNNKIEGDESYILDIGKNGIEICAKTSKGAFYAIQTLIQIIRNDSDNKGSLPYCLINDKPRYAWRGLMLDESRHFFGKEKVKRILSCMAYLKLNKFHWHLTDEPGWRIEIPQYPKLTSVGGCGSWSEPDKKEAQYYTIEDINEIVSYAKSLYIEIIPEIDMPGHATSAVRAYPQFNGGGTKEHPDYTFNVGKEETYSFLSDILKTVISQFPSNYLHIGGDEVAFGIKAWETNDDVQKLLKREKLNSVKDAERYFVNRMADSIKSFNHTLVGWDELLDLHPDKENTVIMWWRHDKPHLLYKSICEGYKTILCPRLPLYFDFIQDSSHKWGRVWNGFCPLKDVYDFPEGKIRIDSIPEEQYRNIIGIQANVWTERIHNSDRLDFMLFPRIYALAEAAWSINKDFSLFKERMAPYYDWMDSLGIYYFDERNVEKHPEPEGAVKRNKDVPMDFKD
jgi:N-acetyl-beta-hexosaminidase